MFPAARHQEDIDNSLVRLSAGELTLELAPAIGGSLVSFRKHCPGGDVDLMRPMSETARHKRDPVGAAMFPMLPYANRIADNRFDFEGRNNGIHAERGWGSASICTARGGRPPGT